MGDSRVNSLFLMQSHLTPVTLTSLYLFFVYIAGPKWMQNRKAYKLTHIITFYNVLQIIYNAYLSFEAYQIRSTFGAFCNPPIHPTHPLSTDVVRLHYLYVLLKALDFIETVIFVLRKKNRQVSFLHVFHHAGIFLLSWTSCKHFPGGTVVLGCFLNVNVHILMYLYYIMSSRTDLGKSGFKKFVTAIQIGHQILTFIIFTTDFLNPYCTYPKLYLGFLLLYVGLVTYLFKVFFKNNYTNAKRENEVTQKVS